MKVALRAKVCLRMQQHKEVNLLRYLSISILIGCSVIVLLGCLQNGGSLKLSRVNLPSCGRGVVALNVVDSQLCCDSDGVSTWICATSYDPMNKVFSGYWSLVIPLIPLLLNLVLLDCSLYGCIKRASAFIIIILFRMVRYFGQ